MATSGKPAAKMFRDAQALNDHLLREAAALLRAMLPGDLASYGQHPGVPTKGRLSLQRNGDRANFVYRLLSAFQAMAAEGRPLEDALLVVGEVRRLALFVWGEAGRAEQLDELLRRFQAADAEEEVTETAMLLDRFSLGSVRAYLRRLERQNALGEHAALALRRRLAPAGEGA